MATNGSDREPGTRTRPVRSLNRAITLAPRNGTIVVRCGQYRDWYGGRHGYRMVGKSLTFQAYPGEAPWFNGANAISSNRWRKADGHNRWSTTWSTPQFCAGKYYERPLDHQSRNPNSGPCAHYDMASASARNLSNDPQMVFVNGRPLRQSRSSTSLTPTSFHYDWARHPVDDRHQSLGQATPRPWACPLIIHAVAVELSEGCRSGRLAALCGGWRFIVRA